MDKEATLKTIEDMLDQSAIDMTNYIVRIDKNGGLAINITKKSGPKNVIPDMYLFSEIINDVSQDWTVSYEDNILKITIQ